jgi:archaellum component FlaG (FlaF/FlaG flagellin family)
MKIKNLFKNTKITWLILVLILALLTTSATSWVLGKYISNHHTNAGVDIMAEAKVEVSVTDNGNGTYTIKNTDESNIPAYVRFTVVVTLRANEDGKLWGTPTAEGKDYTVSAPNCTALSYGKYTYYYFNGAVQEDEILAQNEEFTINVELNSTKADYTLCVEILADAIQCLPSDITKTTWGVTFDTQTRAWSKSGTN